MVEVFVPPVEGFAAELGLRTSIAAVLLGAAKNRIYHGNPIGAIEFPAGRSAPQPPLPLTLSFELCPYEATRLSPAAGHRSLADGHRGFGGDCRHQPVRSVAVGRLIDHLAMR